VGKAWERRREVRRGCRIRATPLRGGYGLPEDVNEKGLEGERKSLGLVVRFGKNQSTGRSYGDDMNRKKDRQSFLAA